MWIGHTFRHTLKSQNIQETSGFISIWAIFGVPGHVKIHTFQCQRWERFLTLRRGGVSGTPRQTLPPSPKITILEIEKSENLENAKSRFFLFSIFIFSISTFLDFHWTGRVPDPPSLKGRSQYDLDTLFVTPSNLRICKKHIVL